MASDASSTDWPALGWGTHRWVSTLPSELVTRSVRESHEGPYRAAVPPSIANIAPMLSHSTLAVADAASIQIARFDTELGAEIVPFGAILLRSESASSSQIENLTSGAKAIALAELGSTDKRNAAEIVSNVRAMQAAIDLADRLDEDAILAMHAALMDDHHPDLTGQW